MNLNERLASRYITALEASDPDFIATLHSFRGNAAQGLSDIFLPTVSTSYADAPVKVMVLGRETKGWSYPGQIGSLTEYVRVGMNKHRDFRDSERCLLSKSHPSGLIRLLKGICKQTSQAGLIYSNLFAVDHNKRDPRSNKQAWPHVCSLSKQLLDIQIEVLQPDIIVFANGIDSAAERREFFPHAPAVLHRCTDPHSPWEVQGISKDHLWGYKLDGRIQCYRIHHPSSRVQKTEAKKARNHLFGLLREASRVAAEG